MKSYFSSGSGTVFSPIHILFAAVLIAVSLGLFVIHVAIERPWLGLNFKYDKAVGGAVISSAQGPSKHIPVGTAISAIGSSDDQVVLSELDFVAEPDGGMGTYKVYEEFLQRQERLAKIQNSPEVILTDTQGHEWRVQPFPDRPLSNLPVEFWIQFVVGVMAWFISTSVWALRPYQEGTRYLLLNGFGMLISAQLAAPYTTRELAIPARLFWWIDGLNFFGGSLFVASLAALLLYYPRKIAPRWVGWAIITIYILWYILQDQNVMESMTDARRILVMIAIIASFVLAGIHWVKTSKDPIARASLQWFLLSWVLAAGVFSSMLFIPQLLGVDTSGLQSYGFILFLLMYIGLSFGILRFRLFGLGEWWYRIVFWVTSMLFLVILDLIFLFGLNLSNRVSLSAALLICGVFWFPLRGYLQSRFITQPASGMTKYKSVVDVALAPSSSQKKALYIQLLKNVFNPLVIHPASQPVTRAELLNHGQAMLIPALGELPAFKMEYAQSGQRLFSPKDILYANDLADLIQHTTESQHSYEKGVSEERHRIARDLHDDVGARLLNGLHTPEANLRTTIQEAIGEIRTIVSGISGEKVPLADFLADIRHETLKRCQAVGLEVRWPIKTGALYERPFDYRIYKNLASSIRELVSNTMKHSGAKTLWIDVDVSDLNMTLHFKDDGCGIAKESEVSFGFGSGLKILQQRISSLNGTVSLNPAAPGIDILIAVPWTN